MSQVSCSVISEHDQDEVRDTLTRYFANSVSNAESIKHLVEIVNSYDKDEHEVVVEALFEMAVEIVRETIIQDKYAGVDPATIELVNERNAKKRNLAALVSYHFIKFKNEFQAALSGLDVSRIVCLV